METEYTYIIEAILNNNNKDDINSESIIKILNHIENLTSCNLYNKTAIIEMLNKNPEMPISDSYELIKQNLIPQIDFNTIFKSELKIDLIFINDDIKVLYKNKIVSPDMFEQIEKDLLSLHKNILPKITTLFINNIFTIITKFINKHSDVIYYCTNIPTPYLKLFEYKCNKNAEQCEENKIRCSKINNIIKGIYFIKNEPNILNSNYECDIDHFKMIFSQIEEYKYSTNFLANKELKDLDEVYRIEIMSYLEDNDGILFLDEVSKLDNLDNKNEEINKKYIEKYIKLIIESESKFTNKMIKFYYIYKMFQLFNKTLNIYPWKEKFMTILKYKLNNLMEEIEILKFSELQLYNGIMQTINETKKVFFET
jgi:hypothetical protein